MIILEFDSDKLEIYSKFLSSEKIHEIENDFENVSRSFINEKLLKEQLNEMMFLDLKNFATETKKKAIKIIDFNIQPIRRIVIMYDEFIWNQIIIHEHKTGKFSMRFPSRLYIKHSINRDILFIFLELDGNYKILTALLSKIYQDKKNI